MTFNGKILVIGLGGVSRCTLPLLFKHLPTPPKNYTVLDFAGDEEQVRRVRAFGAAFVQGRVTRENMGEILGTYVGAGDLVIDLAWNIGCNDIVQWCHDRGVLYMNTSVELWDPYEGAADKPPTERTLYVRHMSMRKMMAGWKDPKGPTAVLDHGANPGLVQHFTKQALQEIGTKWIAEHKKDARYERIDAALKGRAWNRLAHELGVKTIHISERDTQISHKPKRENEFINTWSIEGFYEEGTAPAEMGWGTHEKTLPPGAHVHREGPRNQICLEQFGINTWVRSWVPCGEITGMVVRHGEAFSISEYLTVEKDGVAIYRPTVHYAYCPCDGAINSLHELRMRNYEMQPVQRLLNDDIVEGRDELGCLLMGHDYKSWWIGSLLDIHETRKLAPGQNATTLQVAASILGAVKWMIRNPREGVKLPDALPHEEILGDAKPYLGPFYSKAVDWTPLDHWKGLAAHGPRPKDEDCWQFSTFVARSL